MIRYIIHCRCCDARRIPKCASQAISSPCQTHSTQLIQLFSVLQHIIRKNAVRLMLSYRAANVRDRDKWVAILDEGFVFTLPITPYR